MDHSCKYESCVKNILFKIKEAQEFIDELKITGCFNENTLKTRVPEHDTVPFILQTPYGDPFFTWGSIGKEDCFITIFFKIKEIDIFNNCATLELLKPDVPLFEEETGCVEVNKICEVRSLSKTSECLSIDIKPYTAIKCVEPSLVKC